VSWIVAAILTIHGLIHVMGFVKAFGFAELPQLQHPVSRAAGLVWLAAAILVMGTAASLVLVPDASWTIGILALVLSQAAIVTSWADARFGAIVNVVLLMTVLHGFLAYGPVSYRAEYQRLLDDALTAPPADGIVTETDLARLPAPVARYVRRTGALGQPRVSNFRARIRGRIRGGPADRWMPFVGEQFDTFGTRSSRFFFIDASMMGVPVDVMHVFRGPLATMRVKAWSLVPIVDARGDDLTHAETVTLFNDLCLLAPAALVDPVIVWSERDAHAAHATFTRGPHTIRASLHFDTNGDLDDFVSDDRLRSSADGARFTPTRWSTPTGTYRTFGNRRVGTKGEARWHAPMPDGPFTYLEFELTAIAYNVRSR
jgi:hypothetical protein